MEETEAVLAALRGIRCGAACTEEELHGLALAALEAAGLSPRHEVRLAPHCRIDILCGGVGIEIKKSRPQRAALLRQIARYAACEPVESLVVVAPRGVYLPRTVGGKRVTMLGLERLWGISLP